MLFYSSFVTSSSLIVFTSSIIVTGATLAAQQINELYVVSINETFNISGIIVDSFSGIQIGNILWGGFTWSAAVSLYNLPQYNAQGALITSSSSVVIVDSTTGIITVTNLMINNVGMYVLNMVLTSSNGGYSLQLTSNGILVKQNSSKS
jgi:hypothetical protein